MAALASLCSHAHRPSNLQIKVSLTLLCRLTSPIWQQLAFRENSVPHFVPLCAVRLVCEVVQSMSAQIKLRDKATLNAAIEHLSGSRKMEMEATPIELSAEFGNDSSKRTLRRAFLKRTSINQTPDSCAQRAPNTLPAAPRISRAACWETSLRSPLSGVQRGAVIRSFSCC